MVHSKLGMLSNGEMFISAGMPRSGSTWLFNVARLLLERQEPITSGWIDDLEQPLPKRVLVKVHMPNDALGGTILTCHRDLRDVAASVQAMGWAEGRALLDWVMNARLAYDYWSARAALDLSYERIIGEPEASGRALAAALGVPFEIGVLEAADLPSPTDHRDPITNLHPNHRNDGRAGRWRDQLDPELARAIGAQHQRWLRAHNYACAD